MKRIFDISFISFLYIQFDIKPPRLLLQLLLQTKPFSTAFHYNSIYFSEEILSTLDRNKNIKVRDRATLFNLAVGLDGYTVSSGVISKELNGENIIGKPLLVDEYMRIGTIVRKDVALSRYGKVYMEALKKYTGGM